MSERQNNEINKERKTNLVPAVCTQCGGSLEVDPTTDAAVCPFCGTPFIVEKAINQYNTTHINNRVNINQNVRVQHGKRGIFESAMEVLDNQLEREHNASIRAQELKLEKEKLELLKQEQRRQRTQEFIVKAERTVKDEKTRSGLKKILHYIILFYAWLLIFPIPLSGIINKKEDLTDQQKKLYITIAWIAYAAFVVYAVLTGDSRKASSAMTTRQMLNVLQVYQMV
ncbi:MAG: hypothetical protein E7185_02530 [Erysipelotrichaceae bacterium]|nr:hypothetical protein [Erysipelotrichaceae bacterium]